MLDISAPVDLLNRSRDFCLRSEWRVSGYLNGSKGDSKGPIRRRHWHAMCIYSGVRPNRANQKNGGSKNMAKKLKKSKKLEATKPLTGLRNPGRP